MEWLHTVNCTLAVIFCLLYSYQFIYILIGLIKKPKQYAETGQTNRYAVVIPARNEQAVVGQLIDSVKKQDYPSHLVDIYVVADNCTDNTFYVAQSHGAYVIERNDKTKVGKGHTMKFVFEHIFKTCGQSYYDGYFVFDADNLLASDYITQMDRCMSAGNKIITSHRKSKNYGTNWITAGYSLWFLREAKLLNNVRSLLGTSCAISGTGFLIHRDIINRQNGWKHFLLTEDIEFTIDACIHGEKIAYCHEAYFYDEQPTTMKQSWNQRLRWSKGFLQVFAKYGKKLTGQIFKAHSFSCFDMFMTVAPTFFTTVTSVGINIFALLYAVLFREQYVPYVAGQILFTLGSIYLTLFLLAVLSGISEWDNINCKTSKKIKSFFTFPLFMLTYIPISITAIFAKVQWKEIEHKVSATIDSIETK